MDRLRALEVFVGIAETSSFSAAARRFGLAQSQVSRAIRGLEASLGASLFLRSTRRVVLTAEGAQYLEGARRALTTLAETAESVRGGGGVVTGVLRVTAPPAFGETLAPVLATLIAQHPSLTVESVLTDRVVDITEEGFDVAVRFGPLQPSALRARRLGATSAVLCAAPSYLKARGRPRDPADLQHHEFVVFTGKATVGQLHLVDARDRTAQVRVKGRYRTNEVLAVRVAVLSGAGIAALPRPLVQPLIRERRLVEVLPGWSLRPTPIHAVFPPREPQPARVTAFLDAMVAALRDRSSLRPVRTAS